MFDVDEDVCGKLGGLLSEMEADGKKVGHHLLRRYQDQVE